MRRWLSWMAAKRIGLMGLVLLALAPWAQGFDPYERVLLTVVGIGALAASIWLEFRRPRRQ
jgi:hypothetical protein